MDRMSTFFSVKKPAIIQSNLNIRLSTAQKIQTIQEKLGFTENRADRLCIA
jgi:hypothetical protein